jgi:hypothetical protein
MFPSEDPSGERTPSSVLPCWPRALGSPPGVLRGSQPDAATGGPDHPGAAIPDDILRLDRLGHGEWQGNSCRHGRIRAVHPGDRGYSSPRRALPRRIATLGLFLSQPIVRVVARTGYPEVVLVVGLGLGLILTFAAGLRGALRGGCSEPRGVCLPRRATSTGIL